MNEPVNPKPEADSLVAVQSRPGPQSNAESGSAPASEGPVPLREGAPLTARDYLPTLENRFCAHGAGEKIIPSAFEFFNQYMGGWRANRAAARLPLLYATPPRRHGRDFPYYI